jgi:Protein of unknown function (DUF1353)
MRLALSFVLACCACFASAYEVLAENSGRFVGQVVTRWENDGRQMTIVEPFQFIDPHDRRWSVPRGVEVDGASIPQVFWSLIGGPFEGKYRNASVIHDYYCEIRTRRWQDVHQVFYEAMLASGVDPVRAMVMYKAVEQFGPRWRDPVVDRKCLNPNGTFGKCSENDRNRSLTITEDQPSTDRGLIITQGQPSTVIWPKADKQELRRFLSEMRSVAAPEDLEELQRVIEK